MRTASWWVARPEGECPGGRAAQGRALTCWMQLPCCGYNRVESVNMVFIEPPNDSQGPGGSPGPPLAAGTWSSPQERRVCRSRRTMAFPGARSAASGWRPQIPTRYKVFRGQSPGLGATTLNKASGKRAEVYPSPLTPLNHRLPGPEPRNAPICRCPAATMNRAFHRLPQRASRWSRRTVQPDTRENSCEVVKPQLQGPST